MSRFFLWVAVVSMALPACKDQPAAPPAKAPKSATAPKAARPAKPKKTIAPKPKAATGPTKVLVTAEMSKKWKLPPASFQLKAPAGFSVHYFMRGAQPPAYVTVDQLTSDRRSSTGYLSVQPLPGDRKALEKGVDERLQKRFDELKARLPGLKLVKMGVLPFNGKSYPQVQASFTVGDGPRIRFAKGEYLVLILERWLNPWEKTANGVLWVAVSRKQAGSARDFDKLPTHGTFGDLLLSFSFNP